MTTTKQVAANRKNALQSTGPRTIKGKIQASQNALKHGLLSQNLIVRAETRAELETFSQRLYTTLCPQGMMEELLVEKIVNAAWRLRRVTAVEQEIFNKENNFYGLTTLEECFRGMNGSCIHTLSRYESTLERNLYKAIHELQRIQAMRLGQTGPTAITVEMHSLSEAEIGFVS